MRQEPIMNTMQADIESFRQQLAQGSVPRAYRALVDFMLGLRTHFQKGAAGYDVSGLYQGFLDMTYFALFTPTLKRHDLKVAIVFDYPDFRFEAWLSARNRNLQRQYWELFRDNRWPAYRVIEPATGIDSIIECDLAHGRDLADPEALTTKIETKTTRFVADIERFLARKKPVAKAKLAAPR
jgi:hypothetical protein